MRFRMGRLLLFGAVLGVAAWLFGTERGSRVRGQVGELLEDVPDTLKNLAEQIDIDEVVGVLAERAVAELRPAILELLGVKK